MLAAAGKALAQCFTRAFLWTLAKAFAVTLALLTVFSWLLIKAVHLIPAMPWLWLNATLSVLATLGVVLAALLLLAPVAMIVVGLFLEEIAAKVEGRYYPNIGPPRRVPFIESLGAALGLAGVSVVLNLIALPAYIFLPGLNLAIYFLLNGLLIGREYYLLVAARRLEPEPARRLRRRHGVRIFLSGALIAFLLLIPGVNFLAPLFGTAFMVHLVEDMRLRAGATSAPDLAAASQAAGAGARGSGRGLRGD